MKNDKMIQKGINYAKKNFIGYDNHLALDKAFISRYFSLKGKDVLDFGCGMGGMSLWLAKNMECRVDGYDLDENHIFIAQELYREYPMENVHFSTRNIITEPIEKKYDLILLNDVIEHIKEAWIPQILQVLIHKNLKNDGFIIFTYPPWEGPYASHMHRIIPVPWLQYMPQSWVLKAIGKRNQPTVGRFDLYNEYLALNKMTHRKLTNLLKPFPLRQVQRNSHTKLNRIPLFSHLNLNRFFFRFLVTKELIAFQKVGTDSTKI